MAQFEDMMSPNIRRYAADTTKGRHLATYAQSRTLAFRLIKKDLRAGEYLVQREGSQVAIYEEELVPGVLLVDRLNEREVKK